MDGTVPACGGMSYTPDLTSITLGFKQPVSTEQDKSNLICLVLISRDFRYHGNTTYANGTAHLTQAGQTCLGPHHRTAHRNVDTICETESIGTSKPPNSGADRFN